MSLVPKRKIVSDDQQSVSTLADLISQNTLKELKVENLIAGTINVALTLGASGSIRSAASGTRIQITPDEIAGYNGTTKQFYLQASDGKAYFGAGKCRLAADGALFDTSSATTVLTFVNGTDYSNIWGSGTGFTIQTPGANHNFDVDFGTDGFFQIDTTNNYFKLPFTCREVHPVSAGLCDLGDATYYFNAVHHKTLVDDGCPMPFVTSVWDTFKNLKTKSRKMTLKDVENEGMGSRAKKRVEANPDGEFEELDLSTYPTEILSIPTQEDYDKADKIYDEKVAHAKKHEGDWKSIIKYEPKIGLCTNELVTLQTKAIQELIGRVEALESA